MSARTGPLVLIEPYAHLGGGHHQRTLTALAAARPGSVVITPQGIAGGPGPLLRADACIAAGPVRPAAKALLAGARAAARVSTAGQRLFASRSWPLGLRRLPHQVTLIARCLTEAACLRTARRLVPQPGAVVILGASEALHGMAALLGGGRHLRFIHELVTTEDRSVRWLGRLAGQGEKRAVALYPTTAVRDQFQQGFPHLPGRVRAFAVDDGRRLTEAERQGARSAFTIPTGATAVCLVGGWWPYKDLATVDAALARITEPLHVLVCGAPLDDAVLERWHRLPRVRVHTVPGPVGEDVLGGRAHPLVDERLRKAPSLYREERRGRGLLPLPRRHSRHAPHAHPTLDEPLPLGRPPHHPTPQVIHLPVGLNRVRESRSG
ncbi:hypothetical protein P3T27_000110 [Kitasatospora sp. MAA19]|nr:hypothetical protein [Kitasatospora sp. MAA19]